MQVAVIGSGVMGSGLVQVFAQCDAIDSVFWKGSSQARLERSKEKVIAQWDKVVAKGRLEKSATAEFADKIRLTATYEELASADLVVEAVAENIEVKRQVLTAVDAVVPSHAVLATNTSSLSITELASFTKTPERVVGLHFFNPAPVMALAEVVVGLTTSEATVNWAVDFAKQVGKKPVLVNDAPGFIVNRMLIPMINEAVSILAEGVASASDIDNAMQLGAGHPLGPLKLADLIGNDVNLSILETLYKETGDQKYRPHPLLRKMVRANLLGRKTGKGFFEY